MTRLLVLGVFVLLAGTALGGLAGRGVFPGAARIRHAAPAPHDTTIALSWDGTRLVPGRVRVPRDLRVTFVVSSTAREYGGHLALDGYGDDAPFVPLVPGSTRRATFVANRPGDGFVLTVDGRAVGRLDVTGEHLEEDRR